jgi:hypothetical protein
MNQRAQHDLWHVERRRKEARCRKTLCRLIVTAIKALWRRIAAITAQGS